MMIVGFEFSPTYLKAGITSNQQRFHKTFFIKYLKNPMQTQVQELDKIADKIKKLFALSQGDRAFKNAFKLGAANRLINRIIENREQQKNEGIAGNSESVAVPAIQKCERSTRNWNLS